MMHLRMRRHREKGDNMEKPIVKDVLFLSKKSTPAGKEDRTTGRDLLDTLHAHKDRCVGLAANMIGVNKRIIVVAAGSVDLLMYNPQIVAKTKPYAASEGCLSLEGVRTARRWETITVEYLDDSWKKQKRTFSGMAAQVIQHEMDHLDGILI